ncbi:unnamed protein product, partial [Symbiodinium sp. CCMP2456]
MSEDVRNDMISQRLAQAYQKHLQAELEVMAAGAQAQAGGPKVNIYSNGGYGCNGYTFNILVTNNGYVDYGQAATTVQDGEASPEKTRAEPRVLVIRDVRVCAMQSGTAALLDSGATHSLRSAKDKMEWEAAEHVTVQLAGNVSMPMRMSSGGSLLMPPKQATERFGQVRHDHQTIVPLGELVRTLGYTLIWSGEGCFLEDEAGRRTKLKISGGCPHLQETEALALIARLEDRKREELENGTMTTLDRMAMAVAYMEKSWLEHLESYVRKGTTEDGLRAVRDAPFLEGVPGECIDGLVQGNILSAGWKVFKDIEFLSRAQRRRLWNAKRWVVHLYAGDPGHYEFFQLDQAGTVVLELDVQRCKAHDVLRDKTW